jgi:hypothetical protein
MIEFFGKNAKLGAYGLAENMNAHLNMKDIHTLGLDERSLIYDEELNAYVPQEVSEISLTNTMGVIPQNIKAGIAYTQQFDDKRAKIGINYQFNKAKLVGTQNSSSDLVYNENKRTANYSNYINADNTKSNVNIFLEHKLDTLNKILFLGTLTSLQSEGENRATQNILYNNILANSTTRVNPFQNNLLTYALEADYDHKFKKKGRAFVFTSCLAFNENNLNGKNIQNGYFIYGSGKKFPIFSDQLRVNNNNSYNLKIAGNYIDALIKDKLFLEVGLSMLKNESKSYNNTSDNDANNAYSKRIPSLSNNYVYTLNAFSQNTELIYKGKTLDLSIGVKMQETQMQQTNLDSGRNGLNRSFLFALPSVEWGWKYQSNSKLKFNFSTSVKPPMLYQIQPFVNNYNPQYIISGNPDLTPAYNYKFVLSNSMWNPIKQSNLGMVMSVKLVSNDIVTVTNANELGNVTQSYTQVNGNYDIYGAVDYKFPVNRIALDVRMGSNAYFHKNGQVNNNVLNNSLNTYATVWAALKKNISNLLESKLTMSGIYSKSSLDSRVNFDYQQINFRLDLEEKIKLPWDLHLSCMVSSQILPPGNSYLTNQSYALLNLGLERSFLSDRSLTAKLNLYDILNQNRAVIRNFNNNQINETMNQALTRYGMLMISYRFLYHTKENEFDSDL